MRYQYLKGPLTPAERKRLRVALSAERRLCGDVPGQSRYTIAGAVVDAVARPASEQDPALLDWLVSYGRPRLVMAFMERAAFDSGEHPVLGPIRALGPPMLLPREHISPHFQCWQRCDPPRRALIAFAGNAQRFNMPGQLFHALFSGGFDLVCYLRDPTRQRFMHGLPGLGGSFDALHLALAGRIPRDCAVSVLGTSAGGYAAAALANRMRVDRLALFSPPGTFVTGAAIGSAPATPAEDAALFFGERNAPDHELAEGWRGTPYEGSIRWVDTKSHGTLKALVRMGARDRLIAWLRAEIPGDATIGRPGPMAGWVRAIRRRIERVPA